MSAHTKLSIRKKLAYSLVSVLLFFVLLELALLGWDLDPVLHHQDPFVGFPGSLPLFVTDADSETAGLLVTAPSKRAHFNVQRFQREKPSDTFRVFCLGGSTTYGRPFDDVTSFPGWLRELLPIADPKRSWEIINVGGVSYASYRIAALMKELVHYHPDLFIIYTGHNEFLEKRTYPELSKMSPLLIKSTTFAGRFRTYALIRKLVARPAAPGTMPYQMPGEVDEILNHTVGPSSYLRDDVLRDQVIKHFEFNLRQMVQLARSHGIQVLIVSPASNVKDCSPFKSQHRANLGAVEKARFESLVEEARSLQLEGKPAAAVAQYEQALAIDSRYAELHYQLGRLLLETGKIKRSLAAGERAQEEDVCPLRALADIRESCRRVALTMQVPFVDFYQLLQQQCQQEYQHLIPGQEYFLDHVHPRPAVHRQLAIHIVDTMIQYGFVRQANRWNDRNLDSVDQRVYGRVDQAAHAAALRNLAKVLNWAGKHLEAGTLALQALETLPHDPESLLLAAPYLKTIGRPDQAIEHYQRALAQVPDHAEAHQLLGALLAEKENYASAKQHFLEALRIQPDDWQAHLRIAITCTRLKEFSDSLPHYLVALEHDPENAPLHFHYALSLAELDQVSSAIGEYRKTISLAPEYADAYFNLATLLEDTDPVQARIHYQRTVQLNPLDAEAFFRLGLLFEKEDPQTAASHYRQALKITPDFLPAQKQLEQLLNQSRIPLPN